jgi:isopentenyl-diphosphate Delta-isomerase
MSELEKRKTEHVQIVAKDESMDRRKFYFDEIRLTHRALPEIDLKAIDPSVEFMGKKLSFPLMISSMTGGSGEELKMINLNLAAAAEAEGVAMGVGSQRILFSEPSARASFDLRDVAPTALLFANLGAVQLNYGMTLDQIRSAVDALKADALILHLNPLQEAVQPEGDTNFYNLWKKIGDIVQGLDVPVIVKEVGAGISKADAERLIEAGVKIIDVAGAGGTSWSRIESARCDDPALGELFQDWGIPTPLALRLLAPLAFHNEELVGRASCIQEPVISEQGHTPSRIREGRPATSGLTLIASGGIRSGIDMAKAMVLGASLCGIARPFLNPAMESAEAVRKVIQRLKREFVTTMFLLGADRVEKIKGHEELVLKG